MKKLIYILCFCFLVIGCTNNQTNGKNNQSNSDPVTWLTIDNNKYYYTSTHDNMDEAILVDTGTITDSDDGIQQGLKIYKSNDYEDCYFIKSPDYDNAWYEYKLRE